MSAVATLLAEAAQVGVRLHVEAGKVRMAAGRKPPTELLDRLREHRAEILALLSRDVCRHCGEAVDWAACDQRPAVAFADGASAHLACYEAAEVARLKAAARRVVESEDVLADKAEALTMGALP